MFKSLVAQCIDVCVILCSMELNNRGQCKNLGKPVIKSKERGGSGGNGQLTACVGGRQEDIFIAGQDKIGEVTWN